MKAEILVFVDVSNEIFDLNATSMLDQPDALIKNDFAGSQINLDLLSY